MIPAPVTRSATTVPGSGIAVGGLTGVGVLYMFCQSSGCPTSGCGTGSAIGAGDATTGSRGTGSAIGAGDSTTGSRGTGSAIGAGDSTTGATGNGSAMTGDGDATTGSTGTGSAMTGDGDATTGTGFLMTRGGRVVDDWLVFLDEQAEEKFPDPHVCCAEAGGAAAR